MNDTLNQVEHTPPVHKRILDILPGISGGVARVMIGQPFDTIKVRLQVLGQGTALAAQLPPSEVYKDSLDCVRKMVRNEGPLSFYKGTVAPLVGNMVLLGIHFPTFSYVRKQLEGDDHYTNFSYTNTLLSGAAAGAAGSLVSTPVELVRTKMQLQSAASSASDEFYKGSVDCFKQVLSKYGIKGLYRGFTATVLRDMQGYAWFFLGYESTVNYFLQKAGPGLHSKADLNYMQVMSAGVVAGFGLWGSMFPIDTVKSKLQADTLATPQYRSTYDCLSKVLKSEGQAGLWRGFSAAMYRAIPVNAGIFLAVEGTRQGIKWYEENVEHLYGGVVGPATPAATS
ncbi:hypothetical protein VOLCADRAFT_61165 [Volvox carteri f. nagariensis]|uniref:Uncharacterized protein n=1 Tax=Volvox carteri f. nagariensis TaxID=3068 RepID=D8TXR9_VOLCA|nr:uncharacterized protein VOLCADRAFT_61165 [Volvox carteri f. nagariensis]EFJ47772.1 hypothetical protein VOLCADRAFT_61165 [Volvox carteri f. nagariensis]|eukprot:XP_002951243.1 hypothetical protein VOLCADRAFT_61165 [Volvox carteri f. nagariensis]